MVGKFLRGTRRYLPYFGKISRGIRRYLSYFSIGLTCFGTGWCRFLVASYSQPLILA